MRIQSDSITRWNGVAFSHTDGSQLHFYKQFNTFRIISTKTCYQFETYDFTKYLIVVYIAGLYVKPVMYVVKILAKAKAFGQGQSIWPEQKWTYAVSYMMTAWQES